MSQVEIYSSDLCPYCRLAKRILKEEGITFEELGIWMIPGWKFPTRNFREMKRRTGGKTTVPQIFIDGDYYGDDDTLVADRKSGRLDAVFRGDSVGGADVAM